MKYKQTSLVILAYKEPKKFKKMYRIMKKGIDQDTPYEVIVVDNNSDKEIKDFLKEKKDEIKVITCKKNVGVAKGYNLGAKESKGEYVCFLNSDYYMMKGWLRSMIDCIEHKEKIGIVSCSTNYTANFNERVDSTFDNKIAVVDTPNNYKESEYAIACMFIRRSILESVGWFDEYYFVHWEDLDINEAIKKAGYRVFVNRKCFGYHDFLKEKLTGRSKEDAKGKLYFKKKWGKDGWKIKEK